MEQPRIEKYFAMSNIANMYILPNLDEGETLRFKAEPKEGEYKEVKYKIDVASGEIAVNMEFKKRHVDGTITIIFYPKENKFELSLYVYVPLLGFVDYDDDVYYIARAYIGKVLENINIEGIIEKDKLVITKASGDPYLKIGDLEIPHMNFNIGADYDMCLGTIQTKFPIDALPSMIALIMRTAAMPTSHAWRSDVCAEPGSDVIINDCILYDDKHGSDIIQKFFIKSKSPPKKVKFEKDVSLEKEFEKYVSKCFDEIYYYECDEEDDYD